MSSSLPCNIPICVTQAQDVSHIHRAFTMHFQHGVFFSISKASVYRLSQVVRFHFGRSHGIELLWMVLLTIMVTTRPSPLTWNTVLNKHTKTLLLWIKFAYTWPEISMTKALGVFCGVVLLELSRLYHPPRPFLLFFSESILLRKAQMVNLLPCWSHWKWCDSVLIAGFKLGTGKHTAEVIVGSSGQAKVTTGISDLSLLKTTQVLDTYHSTRYKCSCVTFYVQMCIF